MAVAGTVEKPITAETPKSEPITQSQKATEEAAEKFAYGWREVEKVMPNGESVRERIPLTLYDILHPQVGDFRMHTDEHERYCIYLYNVLAGIISAIKGAIVLHDTRIAWDDPDLEAHGPDIAVIFNVAEQRDWSTFDTAEEGTKPSLIIEVTSPKTRAVDLVHKHDEYEQVGVDTYIIVDIRRRKSGIVREILGYRLTDEGYVTISPDEQGRLWMEPVKLWLAIEEKNLVCYDENDRKQPGYVKVLAERTEAEKRVEEESAARAEAEKRVEEESAARAEAEKRVAEAEKRIQELEAELRRQNQ